MTNSLLPINTILSSNTSPQTMNNIEGEKSDQNNFFHIINSALENVSAMQKSASAAETSYAAGMPGASLGKALVSSDRAEVAWNATVAIRNEIVSAYQSIMNMPI